MTTDLIGTGIASDPALLTKVIDMKHRLLLSLCLLCVPLAGPLLAEDPAPMPMQDLSVIVAPDSEVTGTGTRQDPLHFTGNTLGVLELTGTSKGVRWKLRDAPPKTIVRDRLAIFPQGISGEYVLAADWDGGSSELCWIRITAQDGPRPPPSPVNAIVAKLKAALIGPDAKADAAKLAGLCGGFADAVESGRFATYKELFAAWKDSQAAAKWPTGKYPAIPDVIRLAIPTADETTPVNSTNSPSIISNLRLIEKTAGAIANG